MWSPVVAGIQAGTVVEIVNHDDAALNGVIGQVQDVLPDENECLVVPTSTGEPVRAKLQAVREADCPAVQMNLADGHLDFLLGPASNAASINEAMTKALTDKGFCAIRVLQSSSGVEQAAAEISEAAKDKRSFGRLASEVEEGYLGRGGRARVTWLGGADTTSVASTLSSYDNSLSIIAELLQSVCESFSGKMVTERTAAMVCVTLPAAMEDEFPSTRATSQELLEFYSTWTRGVLRLILFLGPEPGTVVLTRKPNSAQRSIAEECVFEAPASTLLILREDCYEYALEEPIEGECVYMQTFLLEPAAEWNLDGEFTGDTSIIRPISDGPPPPDADLVAVCAVALQAGANMMDCKKEWTAYCSGVDAHLEMPLARFEWHPYYTADMDNFIGGQQTFVKHFSVQEGIELFDHRFFEVSLAEAASMDPMYRQVMEVSALCLAQVGIDKKSANKQATHATVSCGNDKKEWESIPRPANVAVNNQLAILSNRVSYTFNLKGGNFVTDTACSSSLVATHLGKRNLLDKRFDPVAFHLGMGSGLTLSVFSFIHSCAAQMLSSSGRCLTFDATASGYNRGDGTGGMIIKAGEYRDERVALMRGSEIGQDGRSASMSAPNGPAQEKCCWGAIKEARMTPPESTVWECHGTATALGDPIEVGAVRRVQIKYARAEPLMIASGKSNLGHLEGSAAIIAMCKCAMVCYHTAAAPTVHFRVLNAHLEHAAFDAFFSTEVVPYRYNTGHCQVSSFGVGGTNGHCIFWGEHVLDEDEDTGAKLLSTVQREAGKVIVDGPNPEKWHYFGPDIKVTPGSKEPKWTAIVERDLVDRKVVVRWEHAAITAADGKGGEQPALPESAEFYAIVGNFNGWNAEPMISGTTSGLWYINVEVPREGDLFFRLLEDGDPSKTLGPEEDYCERKSAKVIGPKPDLATSWKVLGEPGLLMCIELMVPEAGVFGVNWFKVLA
mmetsp:Transcript_19000/g.44339  ORF Transcript_19000/g.44339 Transcript_19000/m.44339 type:complete len:954 (+) Transcript_19000:72-2933(+)